jgi:hypothetical protein
MDPEKGRSSEASVDPEGSQQRRAGRGDTLKDASDEAVNEMEKRRDGSGYAGAGDIG